MRVWAAYTTDVNGITNCQSPQSVQDSDEIRDLLQLLESMMEIFEVRFRNLLKLNDIDCWSSSMTCSALKNEWSGSAR